MAGMNLLCQKHCFIQLGIPSVMLFTGGAGYKVRSNEYLTFFEACAINRSREMQIKQS